MSVPLRERLETHSHISEAKLPPGRPSSRWWYLVGGILVGSVLTLVAVGLRGQAPKLFSGPPSKILGLTLEPVRLTEGRVSQMAYAAYPTLLSRSDALHLAQFFRSLPRDTARSASQLRDRALGFLLMNRLNQAVAVLEEAVRAQPGDAAVLSDLSALYGERAHAEQKPEDYVGALELAERAVAAAPALPEAVFNRALALEHLFLDDEARRAWRDYLALDGDSKWADEARFHLGRLVVAVRRQPDQRDRLLQAVVDGNEIEIARIAAESPQEAREVFEEELLPKWAESISRGSRERSNMRLNGAQRIADVLAERGGDRIFQKIVAEMELVTESPSGPQASTLVQALRRLRNGQEALSEGRLSYDDAILDLQAAERDLRSIRSATVALARLRQAACRYRMDDISGARTLLERLGDDHLEAEYPSLEARRHHTLGVLAQWMGATTDAVTSYRSAIELYSAIGELQNVARLSSLMAESFEQLGQPGEAWKYRYKALEWGRANHSEQQIYMNIDMLDGAVLAALAQRHSKVALHFQNRLVRFAEASKLPALISWALLRRGRIEVALGRGEEARQDFERALRVLQSVPAQGRDQLAAAIDVLRKEIRENESRAAAIGIESQFPGLLGASADFDFQRGDTDAAERHLEQALEKLEQRRLKIAPGDSRMSFLDQAGPLSERMVALQLNLARPERAFEVLERFRARVLLDQMTRISSRGDVGLAERDAIPLGTQELCRRIPKGTVLVVYAVVDGRLITWLVRPEGIELSRNQPAWSSLSSQIQRLGRLKGSLEDNRQALTALHQQLVAPWRRELQTGHRIIFVPTDALYRVPFAALLDPETGRYLIQDHALGLAPSASQFIAALEQDRRISERPLSSVLLVGNPTRMAPYPFLPSLSGSIWEIDRLSEVYRDLQLKVLTREDATPVQVLSTIRRSDIVHFSVHSIQNRNDPGNAYLILSPAPTGEEISTRSILALRLPRTRLVVLAACGTHAGPVSASEGALSLSSSFLAAGVPAVLGSLWPVNDESTARLSVLFHRELRRGADPVTALRTAQLEEIARGATDWTWASFQLFGGVVPRAPSPEVR